MNRCTETWSPPAVAAYQTIVETTVPNAVTRTAGSKLNRGCSSQWGCQEVGNQPNPSNR